MQSFKAWFKIGMEEFKLEGNKNFSSPIHRSYIYRHVGDVFHARFHVYVLMVQHKAGRFDGETCVTTRDR